MAADSLHPGHPSRTVGVYVDGFNLYYGMLRADPRLKWLDLGALAQRLAQQIAPNAASYVRYFTAKVKDHGDPGQPKRQQIYLRALETLPNVHIHYGKFLTRTVERPLANAPPGQTRSVVVKDTEEKGSDVNLATYLLIDGMDGRWEQAFVISGDSDLVEPIRQAIGRFGQVHVLDPHGTQSRVLQGVASTYGPLPPSLLAQCQLPSTVRLKSGRSVHRPPMWR